MLLCVSASLSPGLVAGGSRCEFDASRSVDFREQNNLCQRRGGGTLFCQKCVLLFCTNNCRFSSFSIFHTHTQRECVSERVAHTRVYHSLWLSNLFLLSFFVCLALLVFLAHYAFLQSFALKGQRSVCLPVCACVYACVFMCVCAARCRRRCWLRRCRLEHVLVLARLVVVSVYARSSDSSDMLLTRARLPSCVCL